MKKWLVGCRVLALSLLAVACTVQQKSADYRVVPLPQEVTVSEGLPFVLNGKVKIVYPEGNADMQRNAEFLAAYVQQITGMKLPIEVGTSADNAIVLALGLENQNQEAYQLKVDNQGVTITAPTAAGVFYGIQTLRKSMPIVANGEEVVLPQVVVNDAPRFGYRGMMLDVSRHFVTLDSVKRYVDMLALHNINTFHWHLTDDQGWRIESKKYPELVKIASQRKETVIGRNSGQYDGKPYGGYYTQDELKELVAYAKDRYITVIPEIDMPGHMQGVLAAFPEFGCTGGPYEVWTMWGISDDVLCVGNDKTLRFIEDVLTELIEIFPSEYIHIGGDECPKVRWEKCPKCQAKIKQLGLKKDGVHSSEERLQSYFIGHMEKFLNEHGRQIIGWDEILEGGLAPTATVMAWRGVNEGVKAVKQQNKAIMVPTSHLYFDYYQSKDREQEPLAIGGYVPIDKVYSFDPIPTGLTPEEEKNIIGTQANFWSEYAPSFSHVEYMVMPRIAALSEVQWTQPDKKNYEDFLNRMPGMFSHYTLQNYNFARHLLDVDVVFAPNAEENVLDVTLSTVGNADIFYTLDGTEPTTASTRYQGVLKIKENANLKAVAVRSYGNSRVCSENIVLNKASLKPVTLLQPSHKSYTFKGAPTLVDGIQGNGNYKTGRWLAFYGNDMEAVIDLQQSTEISAAEINTCVEKGDWIFDARGFAVEVSEDGTSFTRVASEEYPAMTKESGNGIFNHKLTFDPVKARYVKVIAQSERQMPEWHGGKGNLGFLFVDEIVLN